LNNWFNHVRMTGEIPPKQLKRVKSALSPSSPPLLSKSLNSLYNSLDDFNKGVFMRVFSFIWSSLYTHKELFKRGVLNYWCFDLARIHSGLTSSELLTLTYLYQVTKQGVNMVRSDVIYNGPILRDLIYKSKQCVLNDLKHKGYITRHTYNPGILYLSCAHSKQPVFIKMTNKATKVLNDIEKDMSRIMLNTSFNDLTGHNKKPG